VKQKRKQRSSAGAPLRRNDQNNLRLGAMADSSLVLSGVSKRYPGVQALARVSFECRPGEIHAVLGENGSGKSTLLGIAGGAVMADEGRVTIMGEALTAADLPVGSASPPSIRTIRWCVS
jgi:ABC-type sugar transport system ATPase subunit